ncbi:MAG: bifunctional [glutamate--ammonia ligase]-adenylyl-L-tyrosine phosphorylase/[glutamate--ammonia-ligase] adenylyltransferase [Pseudomonadales bacterium]
MEPPGSTVDFTLGPELEPALGAQAERLAETLGSGLDDQARYVFALSEFAASAALRHADWLLAARASGRFQRAPGAEDLQAELQAQLAPAKDAQSRDPQPTEMAALQALLRRIRNRFQLWIVWRHLAARAPLEETTAALSMLADGLIQAALDVVYGWHCERDGVPLGADSGAPQQLVVLALGKLGARELNLSSDVDLIFAYPERGETTRGKTNQQFFVRLGQLLIQALDTVTVDGFAFRVDMRLRPFGASGPLAMHFDAMEDYFVSQGRDWERYAFIKARPCAGDLAAGGELLRALRPFVFRRYLDFGAIDALRVMKARILAERHDADDIKLGPGGIRDVEFVVQVQQLVWGGRQPELQEPALLRVLPRLVDNGHVSPGDASVLERGYRFLRDAEHSLQAEGDRQTQKLPAQALSRARLARSLGFADFAAFAAALDGHRTGIAAVFGAVVAEASTADREGLQLWQTPADQTLLAAFGFADTAAAAQQLGNLVTARDRPSVGAEGRERLDRLMPQMLEQLRDSVAPDVALARVVPVLKAVLRRSAYLALLQENPTTLRHFVELAQRSRWLAEELARHPAFLDALLDERHLSALPDRAALGDELHERIRAAEPEGQERVLDVLREFKEHHVFNVALAEVRGTLPLMKASDYLTFLAEAVLEETLDLAWRENSARYPQFAAGRPFVIVGYGKLGGIELGPGSDLDMVFLHDLPGDSAQFLHRLVRRLLHFITVPTYLGTLYEVDMRLRPSGNAGTMVSSLESFRAYQLNEAWVWEHQALVRARVVAGDAALGARFAAVRREILCLARDRSDLRAQVAGMRRRMAEHHGGEGDLKQGSGGIVDIEFMVQYLVLAHAHEHPELTTYTDNVRILETAERLGLLAARTAQSLREAYLALRTEWHRTVLDLPDSERAASVLTSHRELVGDAWRELFGDP